MPERIAALLRAKDVLRAVVVDLERDLGTGDALLVSEGILRSMTAIDRMAQLIERVGK